MLVSADQLAIVMPRAHAAGRLAAWLAPLNAEMTAHAIDRDHRIEMFLATIAEETGELQVQSENLNYSGARLYELFGGLFSGRAAADALAARGPEAIANVIYADANRAPGYRLGNTQPGDGWKFRGRGPMQLTGRGNYERFFRAVGLPADTDPDYLLTPEGGCKSAAHFWQANGCNEIADGGDFRALTRRVNGGEFNMPARLHYYGLARQAIAGDAGAADLPTTPPPASAAAPRVLVVGCTGPDVLALQQALGATGAA
ncbi:MAG: glycoside hydrolase family 19 protein, partial [Alphaproteobacteria bacterium]|nr:glycoside hydrolase family 19 protein [Alphaproteobacteria bacterium]